MLGYKGPAQPSPALGDALNAGYRYLELRCLGCDTNQTVAGCRAASENDADPPTRTLHEMQGLFSGSWVSLQAQPFDGAAANETQNSKNALKSPCWCQSRLVESGFGMTSRVFYTASGSIAAEPSCSCDVRFPGEHDHIADVPRLAASCKSGRADAIQELLDLVLKVSAHI
ncbi:MAG: hypothetical protein QOF74_9501 [Caballeronia mineralivorans]|jgi:hypothetical protein|nr:hypothetical protein [Caballeronia mineralivorans]